MAILEVEVETVPSNVTHLQEESMLDGERNPVVYFYCFIYFFV